MLYVSTETHAAKYGVDGATLKRMVEAVIKEVEKTRQAERIEQRRVEDRAERAQDRAARQARREQKRRDDAAEKAAEKATAKAEKLEREKREAFASIVELPSAMHEGRLAELAKRLGEDAEVLSAEFAVFADGVERRGAGDIEPWPEPVETKALLAAMLAQLQRYATTNTSPWRCGSCSRGCIGTPRPIHRC